MVHCGKSEIVEKGTMGSEVLKEQQGFRKRRRGIGMVGRLKREGKLGGMKTVNQVGHILFCYIKIENFGFEG